MAQKRKTKKASPKKDAVIDLFHLYSALEQGATVSATELANELKRLCRMYKQPVPTQATVGKRLVALGASVKRERVYTFQMAA